MTEDEKEELLFKALERFLLAMESIAEGIGLIADSLIADEETED